MHFERGDMMTRVIEAAKADDLPAILAFLEKSGLPHDGLSDHVSTTLVAREDQTLVGSVALELYDTVPLLRSFALAHSFPSQGLGQHLTQPPLYVAKKPTLPLLY